MARGRPRAAGVAKAAFTLMQHPVATLDEAPDPASAWSALRSMSARSWPGRDAHPRALAAQGKVLRGSKDFSVLKSPGGWRFQSQAPIPPVAASAAAPEGSAQEFAARGREWGEASLTVRLPAIARGGSPPTSGPSRRWSLVRRRPGRALQKTASKLAHIVHRGAIPAWPARTRLACRRNPASGSRETQPPRVGVSRGRAPGHEERDRRPRRPGSGPRTRT